MVMWIQIQDTKPLARTWVKCENARRRPSGIPGPGFSARRVYRPSRACGKRTSSTDSAKRLGSGYETRELSQRVKRKFDRLPFAGVSESSPSESRCSKTIHLRAIQWQEATPLPLQGAGARRV